MTQRDDGGVDQSLGPIRGALDALSDALNGGVAGVESEHGLALSSAVSSLGEERFEPLVRAVETLRGLLDGLGDEGSPHAVVDETLRCLELVEALEAGDRVEAIGAVECEGDADGGELVVDGADEGADLPKFLTGGRPSALEVLSGIAAGVDADAEEDGVAAAEADAGGVNEQESVSEVEVGDLDDPVAAKIAALLGGAMEEAASAPTDAEAVVGVGAEEPVVEAAGGEDVVEFTPCEIEAEPEVVSEPIGGCVEQAEGDTVVEGEGDGVMSGAVELPPEKRDVLGYMIADIEGSLEAMPDALDRATDFTARPEAAERLGEIAADLRKLAVFFGFANFGAVADVITAGARALAEADESSVAGLVEQLELAASMVAQSIPGLAEGVDEARDVSGIAARIGELSGDAGEVAGDAGEAGIGEAGVVGAVGEGLGERGGSGTPSIRVERRVIEDLLDILRQLVLNKNFFLSQSRTLTASGLPASETEAIATRAGEYDRLINRLQDRLTETRVQPIGRLLERVGRVVREGEGVSSPIAFAVTGGETEVDKFVLDAIAEPLSRVVRHAVSRLSGEGGPASPKVSVSAEDRGSHIAITVGHNAPAADVASLRESAVGFGRLSSDAVSALTDDQVETLLFEPWFEGSDLAGLAEAFRELGGSIDSYRLSAREGQFRALLPVKGAVIGVMRVGLGSGVFAVPIQSIEAIENLAKVRVETVGRGDVLRFRGSPIPLIDTPELFGVERASAEDGAGAARTVETSEDAGVAVVFSSNGQTAALRADRVLGYYEIVIEPLNLNAQAGPFLGGAIQNDGSVALVIDCAKLVVEAAAACRGGLGASAVSARELAGAA